MNTEMISSIVSDLERSHSLLLVSPAKTGKSIYIPLEIYNKVSIKNKDGRIFVVEGHQKSAEKLSKFVSSIQRNKIITYLDETTELKKINAKIIYTTVEKFIQILFDQLTREKPTDIASVVILSTVFVENIFINLIQYIWYTLQFRGFRVPYLLLTSNIKKEFSINVSHTVSFAPKGYVPPQIVYSTFDSNAESMAKDMADVIINYRREDPDSRYLVFIPTGYMASQIKNLLILEGYPSGIEYITVENEAYIPHGEYRIVFDSCLTFYGRRVTSAIKSVCESRAQYGKICKRLLKKESYDELSAGRIDIISADRLLKIALYLSDTRENYKNFFTLSNIPENNRRRVDRIISELNLLDGEGLINKKGLFVMNLPLDGYCSSVLYEILKLKNDIIPEIDLFSAISVSGMNLFDKNFDLIKDHSDLVVLSKIMMKLAETDLSLKEFSKEYKIREKYLEEIKEKKEGVIKILSSLGYEIDHDAIIPSGEDLVKRIEPVLKNVYKSMMLKHSNGNIYVGNKSYFWTPSYPDSAEIPPSESLIPFLIEEFYTNNGLKRKVVLGHPLNDLQVAESQIEIIDDLFNSL